MEIRKGFKEKIIQLLQKQATDNIQAAIDEWRPEAIEILKEELNDHMDRGVSPVEGGGGGTSGSPRYEKYSPSYQKQIKDGVHGSKKVRPVNLKLTGKMRNSLRFDKLQYGIRIKYTDEKFEIHNFLGAGKSHVIRPILPLGNQRFTRKIEQRLFKAFKNAFKK